MIGTGALRGRGRFLFRDDILASSLVRGCISARSDSVRYPLPEQNMQFSFVPRHLHSCIGMPPENDESLRWTQWELQPTCMNFAPDGPRPVQERARLRAAGNLYWKRRESNPPPESSAELRARYSGSP